MKRLIDYQLVRDAEVAAIMTPDLGLLPAIFSPRLDELCQTLFGVSAQQVFDWVEGLDDVDGERVEVDEEEADRRYELFAPSEWPDADIVAHFRELGWDLTDDAGRPLRTIRPLSWPLLAAIHGVPGAHLPDQGRSPAGWASEMAAEAEAFQRRRERR